MAQKLLNGADLAGFIKERQAKQVRGLRQAHGISPKLAIIQTKDDPIIDTYVNLKKAYGADILINVDIHRVKQSEAQELIRELNADSSVHGIIIQLPLEDSSATEVLCNLVDPAKDVDGLGEKPDFQEATPMAIMWLLAGYNVELSGKKILIIGQGKLVGKPLAKELTNAGNDVTTADRDTQTLNMLSIEADVIITAAGSPAILYADMIKPGAIVVDAGTASEDGRTVGDLADDVYERDDITLTPRKGGVGPLTVCALFDNVIRAARKVADS